MTLAQQQPNDSGASAPDGRHYPALYHHHHHPSSVVLQGAPPQQQVASYMVAGPSGGHPGVLQGQPVTLQTPGPNHAYPSSTPGPTAFPGSTLNQQLLQQHTYIQQPVQQVGASEITPIVHDCLRFCWFVAPAVQQTSFMTNPSSLLSMWSAFKWVCRCVTQSLSCCSCVCYRCPRVTARQPTTLTAPASSSTTGPPSTRCPITALRAKTCPSNKVRTPRFLHGIRCWDFIFI